MPTFPRCGDGPSIRGCVSEAVCKPSSVAAACAVADGHPSEADGCPTAHAADPRAGQRTSPPSVARRVAPSYLALLRVEFAAFHSAAGRSPRRHRHCGTGPRLSTDGRYPPPCAAELGLSSRRPRGCPRRGARPSDDLADRGILVGRSNRTVRVRRNLYVATSMPRAARTSRSPAPLRTRR